MLAALLGAGSIATAHAGLLTFQGVTFSSSWSGKVLTLEIDAATHTDDWTWATGLEALEVKGMGDYTSVSVSSAPGGAASWTTSSSELTGQGCSGSTNGQAGSRLCFYGKQIGLSDNMVFSFAFSGNDISTVDPHVKVQFVSARGKKVGELMSKTLPASPAGSTAAAPAAAAPSAPSTTAGTPVTATTPPEPVKAPAIELVPSSDTDSKAAASTNSPVEAFPVQEILQTAELPTVTAAGAGTTAPLAAAAADSADETDLPEPHSIALLLAGLGLMGAMGLKTRRKPRA